MIVPKFSLVDHNGRSVTEKSYQGSYLLVFFGFTHCRVVCPRALERLSDVLARMDNHCAERITPLYISVDPNRDTPEVMKAFLAERSTKFVGLTGTQAQIDEAKSSFRVFAKRQEDPDALGGYVVPHTAITYLIDPHGQYRTHFFDSVNSDELIDELNSIVRTELP